MPTTLLSVELKYAHDVVLTRQRARHISDLLGFDSLDQIRIATAVSELARNALEYAQDGRVTFAIEREGNPALIVRIEDRGPGISDLRAVLDGRHVSSTGGGFGLLGAKRLMDEFDMESSSQQGTTIVLGKFLPKSSVDYIPERLSNVVAELAKRTSHNPFEEIQVQNQELLALIEEVRIREDELQRLNQELAETNRGVVALYSELDEKAGDLLRASELKSSFLSNMSHEFRTPLSSILSLADILLSRMDGDLTSEQEKQVKFINSSAQSLLGLVNDLLDLAKIEAGKIDVLPSAFHVADMFSTLRGTFRPLIEPGGVELRFEDSADVPMLYTDEGKVTQILRNFISNAVKFSDQGTITVSARVSGAKDVVFSTQDMGIGIAKENLELIFVEFAQVPGDHQKAKLGTGLGLPLCRRLANLLGGDVSVVSELGVGSTFFATIPLVYNGQAEVSRGI